MKFKIGFFFLILFGTLSSQELNLTFEDIVRLTLENNPTIKSYQEKLNQAKLREKEIVLGTLPQVKVMGRYSRLSEIEPLIIQLPFVPGSPSLRVYEPVEEQYFTRVSFDFPLFTGLRQINTIKAQKKIVDASEEELKQAINEIVYRAKEIYLKLFLAYQSLKLIESNIEYLETQKKVTQKFFENGLLQENDVLKVELALTQAKIKFFDHQNLINKLNLNLCQILNLELSQKIIPAINIDELLKQSSAEIKQFESPDITSLKNMIKANEYLKKAALGSFLPSLFFNAGYDYAKPNPKYFPVKNEWKYSWDINLVLQFNLWDWLLPLNSSKQIDLQIKQLDYQLNQLIQKSKIEYSDLLNRLKNEENKKTLFDLELKYAKENLRITENKFKEGLVTSSDLLDANRQNIESEIKLLESKVNMILLKEEIKKLNGYY